MPEAIFISIFKFKLLHIINLLQLLHNKLDNNYHHHNNNNKHQRNVIHLN